MTQNVTLRRIRAWICTPSESDTGGLEITNALGGEDTFISITDERVDESGLIRTTGTVVLMTPRGQENTYHPWKNESRWAPGNRLTLQVADEAGTLRTHIRSGLRIATFPAPPFPGSWMLRIDLVDILTLKSFREPDNDRSGITLDNASTRNTIISSLLTSAGITFTASASTIGTISYPIPKTQASFVQQAGAIAIGGACVLWQTKTGAVTTKYLNLTPTTRLFKHVVGVDDAGEFALIRGEQLPISSCRVSGSGKDLQALPADSGQIITYEYAVESSIEPIFQISTGNILNNNTIISAIRTESWQWVGNQFIRTTQERRCRALVIPNDVFEALNLTVPSATILIDSLFVVETSTYEESSSGRLTSKTKFTSEPVGKVLGEFWINNPSDSSIAGIPNIYAFAESIKEYTFYQYDSGITIEQKVQTFEPIAKVAANADNWDEYDSSFNLLGFIESARTETTWTRNSKQEWLKRDKQFNAGRVQSGSVAAFAAMQLVTDTLDLSRSGNNQPPAAERRRPTKEIVEKQCSGSVDFAPVAGGSYFPREKNIEIEYADSDFICEYLAGIFGGIHNGRHKGFRIITIMRDEWLYYTPFSRIDIDYDSDTYIGITDTVNWTFSQGEAIVVAELLQVGRVD